MRKKCFFCFTFQNFFEFCAKIFQTFGQKSSRSCQNYLLRVQTNNFWLEETFKSFEPFLDFLQKPLAWFSKFYLRVQSKNCGRISFFCFSFQNFFEFCAKIFQTFGQKSSRSCQNYLLRVQTNNFWLEETFKSFEPFLDFLQKPLAWLSKFYLRVQSKNSGRNKFFILLFRIFSDLGEIFSDFWPKNFKKLSKLPSTCPEEQFVAWIFFLNHEPFWILCRNLWHVSQNSI